MKQYFSVGTYTEPILFGTGEVFHGKGEGIYICTFEDGQIEVLKTLSMRNPSFLCIDEQHRKIYAVNELKAFEGQFGGGISEVSYDAELNMKLERSFPTKGTDPCHVAVSPDRDLVAVSNFASGAVSLYPLDEKGCVLDALQLFQHEGSSVHPIRQRGPHAHSAIFTENHGMLVPDLGIDQLVGYCCRDGKCESAPELTQTLAPGSGPRFGEFSPDRKHFYLINEIASSVTHFTWDGESLTQKETVPTLPADFQGDNICSDLHITSDGMYLYASNRGHDSLAAYRIEADGSLTFIDRISCGGRTPRNFCLEPSGRYVLVGNQDSDTIVTFQIEEDGRLTFAKTTDFPTPVCIRFFEKDPV